MNFAWHKIIVYFIYFFPLKLHVPYIAPFRLQQLIIVIYSAFFFAALYTPNMIKNCIFLFWKGVPGAQGQSGPPGDRVSVINSFPLNTIQYQCEILNSKWQEATCSWLFTSMAEDLNLVQPRTNPASVQSSTRTLDCQIVSRTRWPLGHATSNR